MTRMAKGREGRRQRRSFTDEFKAGAVRLVLDEGKTVAQVARDIDLTPSALAGWVEQARADRSKGKTGLTTEERLELAKLRKENRELRMERDLLKNYRAPRRFLLEEKLGSDTLAPPERSGRQLTGAPEAR
jgi:transposase